MKKSHIKNQPLAGFLLFMLCCLIVMILPLRTHAAYTTASWGSNNIYTVAAEKGDKTKQTILLRIDGADFPEQIKNLKSSNKKIAKAEAASGGNLWVTYGNKVGKTTISCTVNGVKLKKVFRVIRYTNPLKTFQIGQKKFTAKYNKKSSYSIRQSFNLQLLKLTLKPGWIISEVTLYQDEAGEGSLSYYVNKRSWVKTISLNGFWNDSVSVLCYNKAGQYYETIKFDTDWSLKGIR